MLIDLTHTHTYIHKDPTPLLHQPPVRFLTQYTTNILYITTIWENTKNKNGKPLKLPNPLTTYCKY